MNKVSESQIIAQERIHDLIEEKLKDGATHESIAKAIGCNTSLVTRHYNNQKAITVEYIVKYAEFFKTTTDYLLGLTEAKTKDDTELRAVCDYTGLSEKSIDLLHKIKYLENDDDFCCLVAFLDMLIERYITIGSDIFNLLELTKCIKDLYYFDDNTTDDELLEKKEMVEELDLFINGLKYKISQFFSDLIDEFSLEGNTILEFGLRRSVFKRRTDKLKGEVNNGE